MTSVGSEQQGHLPGQRLGVFLATCGYVGYAPVAPGTFGSAAGLVVFAAAFGPEQAVAPNADEAGRALNRRVEMAPVPRSAPAQAAGRK